MYLLLTRYVRNLKVASTSTPAIFACSLRHKNAERDALHRHCKLTAATPYATFRYRPPFLLRTDYSSFHPNCIVHRRRRSLQSKINRCRLEFSFDKFSKVFKKHNIVATHNNKTTIVPIKRLLLKQGSQQYHTISLFILMNLSRLRLLLITFLAVDPCSLLHLSRSCIMFICRTLPIHQPFGMNIRLT